MGFLLHLIPFIPFEIPICLFPALGPPGHPPSHGGPAGFSSLFLHSGQPALTHRRPCPFLPGRLATAGRSAGHCFPRRCWKFLSAASAVTSSVWFVCLVCLFCSCAVVPSLCLSMSHPSISEILMPPGFHSSRGEGSGPAELSFVCLSLRAWVGDRPVPPHPQDGCLICCLKRAKRNVSLCCVIGSILLCVF